MTDNLEPNLPEGVSFRFGPDGRSLEFVCAPPVGQPIDIVQMKAVIAAAGYSALLPIDTGISEAVRRYAHAQEPFSIVIAERRDAVVAITVAKDELAAYLRISRPFGGREATRADVLGALAEAGVVFGVLHAEIDAAVASGSVDRQLIARGRMPVPGKDAVLESLVVERKTPAPLEEDEFGFVDYREVDRFVTVKAGAPLMRKRPPTEGIDGESVLGTRMPAKAGRDVPFGRGLKGAEISAANPDLLVAAISGRPVVTKNGVTVEDTLTLQGVDFTTGNINFEGRVIVNGDVAAGMKIRAEGDVIINGTVEAADIEASGDILIKGGVIGQVEVNGPSSAREALSMPPPPDSGRARSLRPAAYATGPESLTPPPLGGSRTPLPQGSFLPRRESPIPPAGGWKRTSSTPAPGRTASISIVPRGSLLPPRVPTSLQGQTPQNKGQARVCAGRDVTARFVENAVIEAGRKAHILDAVKQSDVSAKEQVEVGVEGKARARGHIVGGVTRASLLVKAAVLGSPGEVTTIVEVGPGAQLLETYESARAEAERLEAAQGELVRALAKARTAGSLTAEAEARDEAALAELSQKLAAKSQERDALEAQLHLAAKAKVVARERVYAGVLFRIGEKALLAGETRGASACQVDQGRLAFVLP